VSEQNLQLQWNKEKLRAFNSILGKKIVSTGPLSKKFLQICATWHLNSMCGTGVPALGSLLHPDPVSFGLPWCCSVANLRKEI
jgi:hypothetical protein